jgi:alpha-glucosidase
MLSSLRIVLFRDDFNPMILYRRKRRELRGSFCPSFIFSALSVTSCKMDWARLHRGLVRITVHVALLAGVIVAGQTAPAADGGAAGATVLQATVQAPGGARLRIEALDAHFVRVWLKPAGEFEREPSLALETAPVTRVPLTIADHTDTVAVNTGALTVQIDRQTLRFAVLAADGTPLMANARVTMTTPGATWTLTHDLDAGERLFGLGQDNQNNGRLNRRGAVRELWAGQKINSGNVTAEYPVPFMLSTGRQGHAYGVFFDNVHRLRFDLAKTNAGEVRCDADGGEIDLYVIDGPSLADVVERYTSLTGRPSLPPLWALGYWQSKCQYNNWDDVDEAYRQLNSRGFPVDVMVIDAGWPEIVTNYVWAKRWSAAESGHGLTPADKIADYAKKGVKIVMSQSGPMVREDSPTFASGWAAGVFATDGQGHPVECGYYGGKLLDFTSPHLNDWLWPQTRRLNESGVAGWWLDLTEPEGEPPQTHYAGGLPANVHNQFSLLCTRSFEGVQLAVHPDQRPFILTRAGSAGLQRHHAAVWTGDTYSDYATLRAHPPEMLNSGLSGFNWWTCDTGGFLTGYNRNDQFGAHARLYERWMQFSVFSPITRAHKAGGAPEPYQFGPAVEQSTRHYLQLRYRLLPYIYSYAWEASQRGLPLVRPLALEFPDDAQSVAAPGDEYLFGREMLVAPVLFEGQTNRRVYFPPGRWIDWDYGYEYAGGREWVVAAPPNRIPVAVRAGAIIPLAADMKNTGEKPWDPLTLEVFPSGRSSFTLYRDDGATFAYRRGESTLTRFACEATGTLVRFTLDEANKRFTPAEYRVRLHLRQTPVTVQLDGVVLPAAAWSWDLERRVLAVAIRATAANRRTLAVALNGHPLPARPAPELVAEVINPQGEAVGSGGRPVPNFFPPPALPATIKASNYDKGGEGVAFHTTRPVPEKKHYRDDDFGLTATADAGGGYVLGGMQTGEWARYTIDCGNGGYFDLTARVASQGGGGRIRLMALDQAVAIIDVPATGGDDAFKDLTVPAVYLNPGELSLLVYVDAPGFALNSFEFRPTAQPPSVYPAALAARTGVVELTDLNGGPARRGVLRNLGRIGSSVTFGAVSARGGETILRFHYQGTAGKPLPYSLKVGGAREIPLEISTTGGEWKFFDVTVRLQPGANRITLAGLVDGWDSIALDSLELVAR